MGKFIANVAVRMSMEENGIVMLTPQAVNYREFEAQVDMLIAELQKLKQQARAKGLRKNNLEFWLSIYGVMV